MLRLSPDWNDRRWKKEGLFCVDRSKSASISATRYGAGDGVCRLPLPPLPGRLLRVRLTNDTHFLAGPLSSAPRTFPAFNGTISWNLHAATANRNEAKQRRVGVPQHSSEKKSGGAALPEDVDVGRRRGAEPVVEAERPQRRAATYIPCSSKDPALKTQEEDIKLTDGRTTESDSRWIEFLLLGRQAHL